MNFKRLTAKQYPRQTVISVVCEELFTNLEEIRGDSRFKPHPDNRKILAYCLKKYCTLWATSIEVGKVLHRDHSTVLYQWQKTEDLIETNPQFRRVITKVFNRIETYKPKEMKKTTNELLNELVDAHIITEGHKLLILTTVEREKIAYGIDRIKELEAKLKETIKND